MTARPDPDPVISAWLNDEAAERAPERLLSATRTRIESTNQRRAWRPAWRLQHMNNRSRLGGVMAAIAVIVVLGFVLIPRPVNSGNVTPTPLPGASPSATSAPSPASIPTSVLSPVVIPPGRLCTSTDCLGGTLVAGTYSFDAGYVTPADLTFTVPAGWTIYGGYIGKATNFGNEYVDPSPTEVVFATFLVTDVYPDACHWTNKQVSAGTTVDQLANLLETQRGVVATTPTSVTIGGFPAKRIQRTTAANSDFGNCDGAKLHFWPAPGGDDNGGLWGGAAGSTDADYVVDVDGRTFVILARHGASASPADLAELNAVIASIRIASSPASSGPSGASPSP
jgi:hypothetical protein